MGGASVVVDAMGDACDPHDDNDDFQDSREVYLGTDPLDNCPDNSSDDAWPLDIDKDSNRKATRDDRRSWKRGVSGLAWVHCASPPKVSRPCSSLRSARLLMSALPSK